MTERDDQAQQTLHAAWDDLIAALQVSAGASSD